MALVKIILVGVATAVVTLYLKKYSPETAILASVAGGLLIIFLVADYALGIAEYARGFFGGTQIDSGLLKIIVKVTAIAYLVEFSAGVVRDLGEGSLAEKILLGGKIVILATSFPIIASLMNLITQIVNG